MNLNLCTRQIHRALDLRSDVLLAALRGATQHEGSGEGAVADEDLPPYFVEDSTMPGKSVSMLCTPLMHASRAPMTPSWISSGDDRLGQIRALKAEADTVLDILILRLQGVEEV